MKRVAAALGLSLFLLSSCAASAEQRDQIPRSFGKAPANPSAVVAAELSFARLAQQKGQWTAFRETATDDALMFVPQLVNAQSWLKGKTDPAQATDWQPHKIYMSCDGSLGVSIGAWQDAGGDAGYFTTIWQQINFDQRKRGDALEYKWIFDHAEKLDTPLEEPDFVETEVAKCNAPPETFAPDIAGDTARQYGYSIDHSLSWVVRIDADDARHVEVMLWDGSAMQTVVNREIAASR